MSSQPIFKEENEILILFIKNNFSERVKESE
jgi:hypothetical protein